MNVRKLYRSAHHGAPGGADSPPEGDGSMGPMTPVEQEGARRDQHQPGSYAAAMHRKVKRKWWQVALLRPANCFCGLLWPCLEVELEQIRQRSNVKPPAPGWAVATQAYPQVGRAGTFTPAQAQRANGGRWPGSMNTQRKSSGGKR